MELRQARRERKYKYDQRLKESTASQLFCPTDHVKPSLLRQERKVVLLHHSSSHSSVESLKSCLTHCDPMDCSMPDFPVHHHLPEPTQTHIHYVSDAIQPPHPLSSPSPPALNLSQHQVFSSESTLHIRWPKYWSFYFSISPSSEYSWLISFRTD